MKVREETTGFSLPVYINANLVATTTDEQLTEIQPHVAWCVSFLTDALRVGREKEAVYTFLVLSRLELSLSFDRLW